MINKISIINKFDIGLFRDDGLGIFHYFPKAAIMWMQLQIAG